MNDELEKEILTQKELNETEKDLQIVLKDADIDEIGEKLLQEVEDTNKTENFMHQNEVQAMKGATGFIDNTSDAMSNFFKNLEPYLLPFKIIIKRADNTLSAIDALIEYQKTKDGLKVIVKIGTEFITSAFFKIGMEIIIPATISSFVAVAIYTGSMMFGILAGVTIVSIAMTTFWWINAKMEAWLKKLGVSFIDFIKEFETHLNSEEKYYYNLAHCHKTQIKNMQKIQLYRNGKILEDLKHYYYPFYDFKKTPTLNNKNIIESINELKNNYKILSPKDTIDNIHINSEPYLLKALYFCENFTKLKQNNEILLNEEKIKELFPYDSSFYIIFILHKAKLNDTYLEARKRLYESIMVLNQLQNKNILEQNKENFQQYNPASHSKSLNLFILENKDKSKRIIFLDNASSMSNLIHLYDNHCDIFLKNKSLLDIKRIEKECEIDFKALNTKVFFYETLLLGATESHQFLFEDKEENLLYHFKYDKENLSALGDLNIRYHHYNAKIKHYSLLEESLSIKLKPKEIQKEILYNDQSFNKLSKEVSTTSPSSPKEPSFITLILQDEWGKAITNAKVIIKGFRYDESLSVVKLKRKSDTLGKIRFDKEKYFGDCYSFKVKLEDNEAYLSTPLQNAKRIFNNYVEHKIGLILKFKAKEHLVYDGFNVYHYKGRDLITSYLARSGTAKADNIKQSDKQIAHYFYQDEKDKSKGKKAYFYYDDASIKDQFGTLPEGKYYFKINEIAKDLNPSFLKDYPFEIGRTWGKYCVRLYTDKECSKTSKEIKDKDKEQTIIKDNLYLYSVNEKAEFGSSGSIGMAQGELLELFHHQSRFVEDEREGVVCTEVSYPKKETKKIVFANENIDLNTSFAPGTYIKLQLEEKETSEELTWAYIHCESETKRESFLNGAYIIKPEELKNIKYDATNKTSAFHLPISRNNEPVEETKDYKYYIIVFAYDAKKKSVPNEEDAYIIIDMSFRVGVGSDENVRESVLSSGLKSDTDFTAEWKKLNLIADFYDAYNFITLSLLSIQAINSLEKLKNYPQLSGKIVYIYHRFNAVKIYHQIKSKSDMQIKYKNYFQDINDYESKVIKVLKEFQYKADEIYPIKWWGNLTRKICENFNLNINIQTISGDYDGAYDTKTLTIFLNQKDAKKTKVMLKTIIHEIRHAYMHQKELKNDALQRYIYYTYLYVYFDKNKNKEYFGTDKDETKNVYFFQPSESEARAIENDIIKEMQ